MFQTVAQVQGATQYRQKFKYYLLKQLLTQWNMRKHVHFVKHQMPARSDQFSNCAITWYQINTVGYLNQNLVFEKLYACTFQSQYI